MKPIITTTLLLLLTILSFGQNKESALTFFGQNKSDLTQEAKTTIDKLLESIKSKDGIQFELDGYTDSDGNNEYNKILSKKRASSVMQYLNLKGIPSGSIKTEHFGDLKPIAPNNTEEGKQQNRRVEIIAMYNDKIIPPQVSLIDTTKKNIIITPPIKATTVNLDIQKFTCSPKKEIVITGKKGTVLKFRENSFLDKNGKAIKGDVNIELTEIYTKSDMINNNIQTVSDDKLLESSGMIYIKVTYQNSEVSIGSNSSYQIEFPTKKKQKDMGIFYGDTSNHHVNWTQASSSILSDGTYIENENTLAKYVFNSSKLGWINCDRFLNIKQTTNLVINCSDTNEVSFCLVFKNINSVMNISNRRSKIEFYKVPIGEVATIIGFKKKGSKIEYSSKTITIQKNVTESLILESIAESVFQEKIKLLD